MASTSIEQSALRGAVARVASHALPALHLVDAEVAALYSLRQGAFLRGEGGILSGAPLAELLRLWAARFGWCSTRFLVVKSLT